MRNSLDLKLLSAHNVHGVLLQNSPRSAIRYVIEWNWIKVDEIDKYGRRKMFYNVNLKTSIEIKIKNFWTWV